ncbi:MAG: hypothetical protein ACD_28C00209G0002 [uncultured bacterium]|nr:MAG: hypothetical protein ACD_28C00209G0002 [uncultured bacterium]KKT72622.1 MAG: hypothetical protein UW70_C0105G0005 [Candidatus Peregrinibacteria bacterium GW2011_GWA2_44_7]
MKWSYLFIGLSLLTSTMALALEAQDRFGDVENGSWYASAVERLAELNIVQGYPDGNYHPDNRSIAPSWRWYWIGC